MNESVVVYRGFRYLKVATLLCLVAIVLYAFHTPIGQPNGGSWLGYGLGGLGAAIILWLMWFGVRKRRFKPGTVQLEEWLSAHVYLGLALIIIATLHSGFQFGWNVHTLAYVLMMVVILSGAFGLYAYVRYPRLMTENRRGQTLDGIFTQVADLDRECREVAMRLGDEVNNAVLNAAQRTRVGGGMVRQLSGRNPNCPTLAALKLMQKLAAGPRHDDAGVRKLVQLLAKKDALLAQARRDVQLLAMMQIWLFIHVPFTFALVAALVAHVFSVFFYW